MAEYIKSEFNPCTMCNYKRCSNCILHELAMRFVGHPAADVALVVHGRWKLHNNGNGTCSVCNCISVHVWDFDNSLNFCPHCGAKMDGDLNG